MQAMSDAPLTFEAHAPHALLRAQGGELVLNGWPLSRVAQRVGRTPFYAIDRSALSQRVAQLRAALPPALHLHYAVKANPMPAVVHHLAGRVDGLDIASGGELQLALDAGMDPQHISFAGPGKRRDELQQAVASGVLLHVESMGELQALAEVQRALQRPARVALRLNPDFELKGSGMRMGGGAKPFGIDMAQAPAALQAVGELGLQFEGFHVYAGSQNLRAESLCEAQHLSLQRVLQLAPLAPSPVRHLNLGGGLGVPYFPQEQGLNLDDFKAPWQALVRQAAAALPQARLCLELGRYLVAEAGVYVCRVLDRKVSGGTTFVVVDGGLHHHLAASGNFGQVIRKNYPVALGHHPGVGPSGGADRPPGAAPARRGAGERNRAHRP